MPSKNYEERILDANSGHFATAILPLYCGPQVTIRIGSASHEYKLPRALLCKQSPYFAAMFEGPFQEGQEQSATLEEVVGVVSTKSFQLLVQWICLGRVVFRESTPEDDIAVAIEFARLADMCNITGVESMIAEHIKAIIIANRDPENLLYTNRRAEDTNTHSLTSRHITSAVHLREGHPVRAILAAASVEGYLRQENHKFMKETSDAPEFATDLLRAVKDTLKSITYEDYWVTFQDPISEIKMKLRK